MVAAFGETYDFGLYTPKYNLFDDLLEDIQRFGSLSVSDSCLYMHYNAHIKHVCEKTLQTRLTSMIKTIGMIKGR